ncbi:MAG: SDR family oxidoreductase [Proteobacteria bacterium]|nr:SDR family oxidoreductase [Pseudomonadota bacterium]HQR02799.1 SDR family oxidoreductase [Rhodocyclaceae bacterium]
MTCRHTLEGRNVLVSGGATGIGRACAVRAVAEGAIVTICGRNAQRLESVAGEIAAANSGPGAIRWMAADVTRETDVERIVAHAAGTSGKLHGCIANAGGGGMPAPYHLQTAEEFQRVLGLNVMGTLLCIKHSISAMMTNGGGSFIAMSSIAAGTTHRYFGAYPAAKAAMEAMMLNAADEYGHLNIRFNSIRPGYTATEIMENVPPESLAYRSYVDNTPMGGVSRPEDIADLARFLLSDESRRITGQVIAVDGGNEIRRGPDFSEAVTAIHGERAFGFGNRSNG